MILEEFNNTWNYTFIIVMIIAVIIGTIITLFKMKKEEKRQNILSRKEKRRESDIENN